MSNEDKRNEAKRLYIRENKDIKEIAKIIHAAEATIYRWKKEDKDNNEDWDENRDTYNLSPEEIEKIYLESVKEMIVDIKKDPSLMRDSKVADAMSKHIANLKKLNPKQLYLGVGLEVLKVIAEYFKKNNEEKLHQEFIHHFDGIRNEIINYFESQ
ncbi:MAG: DUF1804 family protein [Spirochaetes bacterium]|nr:DUF1804 family protein [Spirochaetota bacterium]